MRIRYTKRTPLSGATERRLGVRYTPFDTLLGESDVVSIHVPHTAQTKGPIGAGELASIKSGALLINTENQMATDHDSCSPAINGRIASVPDGTSLGTKSDRRSSLIVGSFGGKP